MTGEEIYGTIEHLASYSVLLPALVCLFRIKALNLTLWALFIYLLLCFIVDQKYLSLLPDKENANLLLNCWTVVECLFFCFIYFLQAKQMFFKLWIAGVFLTFLIVSYLTFRADLSIEDKVVSPSEAGIIIPISICILLQMVFDDHPWSLFKNYFFWINSALLLYFCTAIFIFIENDHIIYLAEHEPDKAQKIWAVHEMIGIFCNILIFLGICLWKPTPIQS